MNKELTLLTCNFNTPNLVVNMLKSLKKVSTELPTLVVMNTSKSHSYHFNEPLIENEIPFYNFRNGIHGEAVNLGLKKINTRYVLLVDSDVIFLQDYKKPFEKFKDGNFSLMGNVVGSVGEKKLWPRVEPWYCFIDLDFLKKNKIQFFDRERTKKSKEDKIRVYDVGSTMFEDVVNCGGLIANVNLEGKYFKHYGGMSWRAQKFNPDRGDTDIDFGGTHPHRILYDIAMKINQEYQKETEYLNDINIKGVFQ